MALSGASVAKKALTLGKGATKTKQFNKLFVVAWERNKPEGKTRIQQSMDIVFGRKIIEKHVPLDEHNRNLERSKPRSEDMSENQDWPSVWPAAQTFKASAFPVPIRMGYRKDPDKKPRHGAYGNLELMKIPNFLHLTPRAVYRHCKAIKKFCTKFPEELKNSEVRERWMPLRLSYRTFVHQGTDIRDPRSRDVVARVQLASLRLRDTHAHNKCRQLVGHRYSEDTDTIIIEAKRCPFRRQNIDYANYLLTALYHESHRVEPWEANMVQELLALRERDRLEAEGAPESEAQRKLMMRPSEEKVADEKGKAV